MLIDYTNTGFEKIVFDGKLTPLAKLCKMQKIIDIEELFGGTFNKVYKIQFPSGNAVLKISPLWSQNGLLRESWCIRQIQTGTSLRIPNILAYCSKDNDIFPGHELLIIEFIPGRLIQQSDFCELELNRKINRIYRQLHTVLMKGFGWLDDTFVGMYPAWSAFLKNIDNIELTLNSHIIDDNELKWFIEQFTNTKPAIFEPCLLHGDFKWSNFILCGSEIVPIDFQNCYSGDYLYDIGIGLFFHPQMLPYINLYTDDDNDAKTVILYGMRHAISAIGHRISVHDSDGVQEAIIRYQELKKLL